MLLAFQAPTTRRLATLSGTPAAEAVTIGSAAKRITINGNL
jgi:hypothetical protein